MTKLNDIVNSLDSISLSEMDAIKLMNRQDTKYIFSSSKLNGVISDLSKYYKVLEIDGKRIMSYGNVYFDTSDFEFFRKHHSGKLNRHKIRNRAYVESDIAFCELKFKSNKKRTQKQRTMLTEYPLTMTEEASDFLSDISPVKIEELEPKLQIDFNRITLAHKDFEDRCTIDFNLIAKNDHNSFDYENLVIAEIKQKKFSAASSFNQVLKSHNIYPLGFSKYAISIALMYPKLKQNRFKPKLLKLKKIMHGAA